MDWGLNNRVVLITGGSAGIGRAVAKVLAAEGARVVIAARRAQLLESAAESIERETGRRVLAVSADTTVQEQVDQLVARVLSDYSRLDVLVNCAANPSGLVRNEVQHLDDAALLQDLNTKVVGYARCAKAVTPAMIEQRWGRIINIGGLTGRGSSTLSGMRNVAICHLTKTLSDQLGPHGITVNLVHPGVIETPHLQELFASEAMKRGTTAAAVEASYVAETPVRRILGAEEIADAALFLASPRAASITGESIAVDGGITRGIYL